MKKQKQQVNEMPVLMRPLLKRIKATVWPDLPIQSVEAAARTGLFETTKSMPNAKKARYFVKPSVLEAYLRSLGADIQISQL